DFDSHALTTLFFFNESATPALYTLSLHDALPICYDECARFVAWDRVTLDELHRAGVVEYADSSVTANGGVVVAESPADHERLGEDRKSTRLNSSHSQISYAVFCLKKKKNNNGR